MHKMYVALCASVISVLSIGLAFADSARVSIEATNAQFMKDFEAKDAAAVAAHYTQDAAAFPPDEARVDGRDNIQKMWKSAIDGGWSNLRLTAMEVEESGDSAYEVGVFAIKVLGADGKPADSTGKYIVIWKRGADGKWLLHRDIWNSDPKRSSN